jgi:acyl-CoA thioester hydrolase
MTFTFSIRVPYAHIDKMGIVYYANYFVYFEMARAAMLREVGLPYGEMEERGVMLPVVESHCEYKSPAHYDELLVVLSKCVPSKGTKLHLEYEIRRDEEDGDLIATGYTDHVCMSPEGKVLRPVPELERLVQ